MEPGTDDHLIIYNACPRCGGDLKIQPTTKPDRFTRTCVNTTQCFYCVTIDAEACLTLDGIDKTIILFLAHLQHTETIDARKLRGLSLKYGLKLNDDQRELNRPYFSVLYHMAVIMDRNEQQQEQPLPRMIDKVRQIESLRTYH